VTKVNIGIVEDGKNLLTTAPVDELGQFRLDGIDLTGEASLIVSALNKKGDPKGLIQMDTLRYIPEEVSIKEQGMIVLQKENATGFAKDYQLKEKVLNQFKLSDTISLGEINVYAQRRKDFQTLKVENNRMHYDKPDNAIVITSKYAGYPNIFEIIRGRFAGVQVNGFAPSYDVVIRGFNSKDLTHFPLFLIDGVKKTYEYMLQFPVGLIERIDVLKSAGTTAGYGAEASNGVISVITRTGDIASIPKNVTNHSGNTKMTGYDSPRIFFSPMHYHVRMPEFDPDLRTTLLWEPNISLKSNKYLYLKYFNSDLSTTIRVMIEGITSTGIPITATTEYEVK